jgi:sugar-phosphatase
MQNFEFRGSAILFDMDGTLVDSTECVERQWRRWARRHGLDADAILAVSHGRRNSETIREVAPHLAIPEVFAEFDAEELGDRDGVKAIGGATLLLNSLPLQRWAVVTSAPRKLAQFRIECAGLPLPAVLVSAEDVENGKPDPSCFLLAARLLEVSPERCLVVEDTPAGLAAAQAAGMAALGIATTYTCQELGGVPCIPDFHSIRVAVTTDGLRVNLSF